MDIYSQVPVTDKNLRQAVYLAFNGKCFYTGRDISIEEMHIDHIQPVNKGGKDCIANYVLTCQDINLKKNNKYTEQFGRVVHEIVALIYAQDVLKIYSDLNLNVVGMIQLNSYLREIGLREGAPGWSRFRNRVAAMNLHKVRRSQRKIFYRREDLEKLMESADGSRKARVAGSVKRGYVYA